MAARLATVTPGVTTRDNATTRAGNWGGPAVRKSVGPDGAGRQGQKFSSAAASSSETRRPRRSRTKVIARRARRPLRVVQSHRDEMRGARLLSSPTADARRELSTEVALGGAHGARWSTVIDPMRTRRNRTASRSIHEDGSTSVNAPTRRICSSAAAPGFRAERWEERTSHAQLIPTPAKSPRPRGFSLASGDRYPRRRYGLGFNEKPHFHGQAPQGPLS